MLTFSRRFDLDSLNNGGSGRTRWRLAQGLERVAPVVMSCRIRCRAALLWGLFTYIKQAREQQTFSRARLFLRGLLFRRRGIYLMGFPG